uniref:INCENP_ARK-bind domain-containing protein n=1 Tax=Panagrellus redivivus TaxID=6233 RepID=A0A7E4VTX1_PANRE
MGDINVFNTFSFKRWSERLKEKKIEDESQQQRLKQVTRLKEKLSRERELRDQADLLTDSDIEKLIQYLNAGNSLNAVPYDPNLYGDYPGYPYDPYADGYDNDDAEKNKKRGDTRKGRDKSDDDIFNEIMEFYANNPDHNIGEIPEVMANDPNNRDWDFNRRFANVRGKHNENAQKFSGFEYNRKFNAA